MGGRLRSHPWGAAPRGPRLPGGGPHFSREMGKKRAGAPPLDPGFIARSLSFARFGDRCLWYDSGAVTSGMLRPIWDAFFRKKYAGKHFCERKIPNQGIDMGPVIVPRPPCCAPTSPKPSPWGEGAPVRTLGRMRGRSCTQPFLVDAEKGGSRLSPQRKFSSAPLGNPVAPSSVTSGDSFPSRGSLWVVQPYTKKAPQIRARTWAP